MTEKEGKMSSRCRSCGSRNPEKETEIFANRLDSCFRRNDTFRWELRRK